MDKGITPSKFQRFFIKRLGIDKYVEEYEKNKHKFDQLEAKNDDDYFQRENKVWYNGKAQEIEYFYKSNYGPNIIHQYKFWQMVNTQMPRLHYPLASTITETMGNLLFNNKPEITVDTGAKTRNKKLQSRLDDILDINEFQNILKSASRLQSYSGGVALKINFDTNVSDVPLITTYPKEDFEVFRKYGKVVYIDFIDYYGKSHKLISRYGRGYIHYRLYEGKNQVSLKALDETAHLEDMAFFNEDGDIYNYMFASVIGNKTKEGQSDYADLHDTFHAIDETYSTFITYIRRTKPNVFISEDLAKKDKNGKALPLNEFDNILTVLDTPGLEQQTTIERSIVEIKTEGYRDTMAQVRNVVLEKIGISPATIGIDNSGANASGEALRARERSSIATRAEKLGAWEEPLREFIASLLIFDELINDGYSEEQGIVLGATDQNFEIMIDFGQYIKENLSEQSAIYRELLKEGAVSVSFVITQIFGDKLNEEQLMRLIVETKNENQKPLSKVEQDWFDKDSLDT